LFHTGGVTNLRAVKGDITQQNVDAIVSTTNVATGGCREGNAATRCRDEFAISRNLVHMFPSELAIGEAGWTTARNPPARWVIYTVSPYCVGGQRVRSYRRAIQVADEVGARSVAVPLISTDLCGWPLRDAIAVAVSTLANMETSVEQIMLVASEAEDYLELKRRLRCITPFRILQAVGVLHGRGYHRIRICPYVYGVGWWRIRIATADNLVSLRKTFKVNDSAAMVQYSLGSTTHLVSGKVDAMNTVEMVADLILDALSPVEPIADDPDYVSWSANLVFVADQQGRLPVAYEDYFDDNDGWKIGDLRYPHPPTATVKAISYRLT
jgi:O-acetyl-ADP-ribose deacetylase